jgi:hypothetical protein
LITRRAYQSSDEAALRAIHARQCEAIGAQTPYPANDTQTFAMAVFEENGRVVGAVVAHAAIELYYIAADAMALRAAWREHDVIRAELAAAGIDEVRLFELESTLSKLEPLLRRLGFHAADPRYRLLCASTESRAKDGGD